MAPAASGLRAPSIPTLEIDVILNSVMRTAALALAAMVLAASSFAAPMPGQGNWTSTLQGRDIDRHAVSVLSPDAVYLYDSALGVTWLRDARGSAQLSWADATAWASDLVTGSGGAQVDDWRLPTLGTTASQWDFSFGGSNGGFNVAPSSSELAHLFHVTLGNTSAYDTLGNENPTGGLTNTGSFNNLLPANYWLGTGFDADAAWNFDTSYGAQNPAFKQLGFGAIAVRSGDVLVSAVPEPQGLALALAGLAAMGCYRRRVS